MSDMPRRPHRSNHLRGSRGAGGNVLLLDGHVEWRGQNHRAIRAKPGHDEYF